MFYDGVTCPKTFDMGEELQDITKTAILEKGEDLT
jgi:hypothetical protein